MTLQAGPLSDLVLPRLERREVALWSAAALVVVAAHAGSAWLISQSRAPVPPADAAPAAIMLELAPMTVAPEAVPMDTADLVDSAFVQPSEEPVEIAEPVPEEPVTDPVEETEVSEIVPDQARQAEPEAVEAEHIDETPPEETVAQAPPEETMAEAEEVIPDIVEAPLPEVAMAVPESKPVEEPAAKAKPADQPKPVKQKPAKKVTDKPAKPLPKKKAQPQASLAMTKSAQNAPKAAASAGNQGARASAAAVEKWKNKVLQHIRRRMPEMQEDGKVDANINITASGDIVAVWVTRSSGNPRLDKAALKALRRSSPVPAPPDGLSLEYRRPGQFEVE